MATGLSMPHSPRYYQDSAGDFGHLDLSSGEFIPVAFCPGYLQWHSVLRVMKLGE